MIIENESKPLLLYKGKPERGAPSGTKIDPKLLCLTTELCYMCDFKGEIISSHEGLSSENSLGALPVNNFTIHIHLK